MIESFTFPNYLFHTMDLPRRRTRRRRTRRGTEEAPMLVLAGHIVDLKTDPMVVYVDVCNILCYLHWRIYGYRKPKNGGIAKIISESQIFDMFLMTIKNIPSSIEKTIWLIADPLFGKSNQIMTDFLKNVVNTLSMHGYIILYEICKPNKKIIAHNSCKLCNNSPRQHSKCNNSRCHAVRSHTDLRIVQKMMMRNFKETFIYTGDRMADFFEIVSLLKNKTYL